AGPGRSLRGSSLLLVVEMVFEGVEVLVPQAPVRGEPLVEGPEGTRFYPVDALLRGRTAGDETGFPQHLQVLGHGRLADLEHLDELADAAVGPAQHVEDPAPGRLGDDREGVNGHTRNILFRAYACQGLCPRPGYPSVRTQVLAGSPQSRAMSVPVPSTVTRTSSPGFAMSRTTVSRRGGRVLIVTASRACRRTSRSPRSLPATT